MNSNGCQENVPFSFSRCNRDATIKGYEAAGAPLYCRTVVVRIRCERGGLSEGDQTDPGGELLPMSRRVATERWLAAGYRGSGEKGWRAWSRAGFRGREAKPDLADASRDSRRDLANALQETAAGRCAHCIDRTMDPVRRG